MHKSSLGTHIQGWISTQVPCGCTRARSHLGTLPVFTALIPTGGWGACSEVEPWGSQTHHPLQASHELLLGLFLWFSE